MPKVPKIVVSLRSIYFKLDEGSGCFIRHAREGGHPGYSVPNLLDSCLRRNDGL
jgi:hypothetical protein